ncbi:alpha/beta hydrolase [Aureimonas sp. AU4]|uniref:alpha/beta hydrolase n=1 Tax=Aureimonas sp. AU4 TaxID=1638163 RepID=UPI000705817F|nr:alpha/beta hydrolase [Aureimonas sp. AU4]BAT30296.1 esterase [Aureimonas sp. AU4]
MTERHVGGVAVPARIIPFPTSISPEARTALERLVREDGTPHNALHVMPSPDDHAAWTAMQAAVDAQYAQAVRGLADTPRAAVETRAVGDARLHVAVPADPDRPDCALIDLHGGAFVFGGGDACRQSAQIQADRHGVRCYGVDYRLPPQHPHPAALDDGLTAYRYVMERHDPGKVVVFGRSAGGNLALAIMLRAKTAGLPLPAGLVLLSPEVDLTESGDSFEVNRLVDVVLPHSLRAANRLHANGAELSCPELSPLFGDLTGLPPTFVQSGTRDLFLSNAVRLHRALRRVGVAAELHVFEGMPHGGFGGRTPEDLELAQETARFIGERWSPCELRHG